MHTAPLPFRFEQALAGLCPDWAERRFLAACSGGLDSTALLHLASGLLPPGGLAAAHLNHLLRGAEAEADRDFVAAAAAALGRPFLTRDLDVAALARRRKKGLEEAARRARYDFLLEAARECGAEVVLTAHQADDQAETVLMRFLQGAGPTGLAGIPPRRPGPGGLLFLRPLLAFTRAELGGWLAARGLTFREDATNRDAAPLRNRLRLEVLPRLRGLNPALTAALGRTAAILRVEEDFWERRLAALWPGLAFKGAPPALLRLSRAGLAGLEPAEVRRVLHRALGEVWRGRDNPPEPPTSRSVELAAALLQKKRSGGLDLPGGLRVWLDREWLYVGLHSRM